MKINELKKQLHPLLHKYIEEEVELDDDEKEEALEEGDEYEDEDYLDVSDATADEIKDVVEETLDELSDDLKSHYELNDEDIDKLIQDTVQPEFEKEIIEFDPDNKASNGDILDHVVDVFEIPADFAEKVVESYDGHIEESLKQIYKFVLNRAMREAYAKS